LVSSVDETVPYEHDNNDKLKITREERMNDNREDDRVSQKTTGTNDSARAGKGITAAAAAMAKAEVNVEVAAASGTEDRASASSQPRAIETFEDMGFDDDILRGIFAKGFEYPSVVQQLATKPVMDGHDVIAQAQSGTGKTASFSLGSLYRVDRRVGDNQVIILSPTRELAKQTHIVLSELGDYVKGLTTRALVGGGSVRDDIRALRNGIQVVVGTPGRVAHMIAEGHLRTEETKLFILDEADEMLQVGFEDQVRDVIRYLPESVQCCLFSATMPKEVLTLTTKFMRDPVKILVKADDLTLDGIKQFYVALGDDRDKLAVLLDLYREISTSQTIIFANTRRKVDWLQAALEKEDFTVSALHGDIEQRERDVVMREFRSGSSRVLLATDVLARGIDVQGVSLVINFDIPANRENYIHRIGRSGRFGRKGIAINFVTERDARYMRDIEQFYETEICELPQDVAETMAFAS